MSDKNFLRPENYENIFLDKSDTKCLKVRKFKSQWKIRASIVLSFYVFYGTVF